MAIRPEGDNGNHILAIDIPVRITRREVEECWDVDSLLDRKLAIMRADARRALLAVIEREGWRWREL